MEEEMQEEFRPGNDSRKRPSVETGKDEPMKTVESKPTFMQRWGNVQPTKAHVVWACLATAILTMIIGFNWGGWVTAGSAQKAAETMAKDAVVQRLVPICVAQFNLDPDKSQKLGEMSGLSSYQRSQFVRDQGWATISGVEKPDNKVADACTKLLLEMNP